MLCRMASACCKAISTVCSILSQTDRRDSIASTITCCSANEVKGNLSAYHSIWHYGEAIHDLGGTARTLDEADGAIPLEHGIVSALGYSVLDDSRSQVLLEDGWIEERTLFADTI